MAKRRGPLASAAGLNNKECVIFPLKLITQARHPLSAASFAAALAAMYRLLIRATPSYQRTLHSTMRRRTPIHGVPILGARGQNDGKPRWRPMGFPDAHEAGAPFAPQARRVAPDCRGPCSLAYNDAQDLATRTSSAVPHWEVCCQ